MAKHIPQAFNTVINKLKKLQTHEKIIGAFVFGSVASGDIDSNSDVDVKVITTDKASCSKKSISHPYINGKKLDISFQSFSTLKQDTDEEIKKASRPPIIASSLILFDKNNKLHALKKRAEKAKPKGLLKKDYPLMKFMIEHMDDKAKRNLDSDPTSALLAMEININELLKYHYQINRRWWVSNKKLLNNLRSWDKALAKMVQQFVLTNKAKEKYLIWEKMVNYVARQIGGRLPIKENNCDCPNCAQYLSIINNL